MNLCADSRCRSLTGGTDVETFEVRVLSLVSSSKSASTGTHGGKAIGVGIQMAWARDSRKADVLLDQSEQLYSATLSHESRAEVLLFSIEACKGVFLTS